MISLNQVQLLEQKVEQALNLIAKLREENKMLKSKLASSQQRLDELEGMVTSFKGEQEAIEKGILKILAELDRLEDDLSLAPKEAFQRRETSASGASGPNQLKKPLEPKLNLSSEESPANSSESKIDAVDQHELDIF